MPHVHTGKDQFDFTVEVFIVYKNKVLLRKHDKYGIWLGVGGHIELNEDPNQTAIREVKEEVGLKIQLIHNFNLPPNGLTETELIPPFHLNKHSINKEHNHIALIYYAKSTNAEVVPEKPDDEWKWLSKEEIIKNKIDLSPNIKFYAIEALKVNLNY